VGFSCDNDDLKFGAKVWLWSKLTVSVASCKPVKLTLWIC
jgi:hypothetical protein